MAARFSIPSSFAATCRRQWLWLAMGTAIAQANPGPKHLAADENGNGGPERKLPAVSLLPAGSVLRKVMIPRYDRDRKLTAVLRTAVMTIVDPQTVEGEQVSLELYHPDRSQRARMDLVKATFDQRKGTLDAREPVDITSADFSAHGAGLIYTYEQAKGFLLGPVSTRFYAPPPKTSMTRPPLQRAAATALAATLIASPAGAEPQRLTPEERADMAAHAAPVAGQVDRAQAEAKETNAATQAASTAANGEVAQFVEQAGLKDVTPPVPANEGKPLDVKPGPNDTVIQAKDGMYFDAEKGLLVFLKDVQLTDPRFNLSGANELKIFLEKKPAPTKPPGGADGDNGAKEKSPPDPMGGSGGFGDVERIVATGKLRITRKSTDGKPDDEASAAVLTYHAKTGELVLHGGYPWIKRGDGTVLQAREPDLYLRWKDGNLITEGNWDTIINFAKPDKPKQP